MRKTTIIVCALLMLVGLSLSVPGTSSAKSGGRSCETHGLKSLQAQDHHGNSLCTHGDDAEIRNYASAPKPPTPPPAPGLKSGILCEGDGVSGKRVQAVYFRQKNQPDNFATTAASIRATYAPEVEAIYSSSAKKTGGSRHVRWVTSSTCTLSVISVVLPNGYLTDFNTMIWYMDVKLRLRDPNRIYLVWADEADYCGIGTVEADDSPGLTNLNATTVGYARVDRQCWDGSQGYAASHELGHAIGAVQMSAPNSDGTWHCTDNFDVMCYPSDFHPCPPTPEANTQLLLDCNDDDYFSTNPPAGSYLATHWNIANNPALSKASL